MNHRTSLLRRRYLRGYVAIIISYLMLVGQVAPLALAANGPAARPAPRSAGNAGSAATRATKAAAAPAPLAPLAPAITATKTDNVAANAAVNPGGQINYEVTVANSISGSEATNVQFSDTIDANTTLSGSVTMSPLARNDSYTATINTQLVVAASGVLANDSGAPLPTAVPIASGPTTQGGTVTLNANGSFTYNPPSGFTGSDTFDYTATNSSPETDTATVTITVGPADTPPTAVNDTATVNEDTSNNAIDVLTNDTDGDGGDKFIASASDPTNGSVALTGGTTGAHTGLTYTPDAGYCGSDSFTYTLTPGSSSATVNVTVTCLNDAPTDITLSNNTVAENSASGTAVGDFTTTDPDDSDTHTYTLVAGSGSTDNASFQIVGNQLQTAASLNFETKSSYSIRVRSTDSGSGNLNVEEEFTITLTNVNEAPTDIALSNTSVGENMPSGTVVGDLSTTDPDASDTHTYTLVAGSGSTDNASFQIVGNQLQTAAVFNYETKNSYSVRIRSTDSGSLNVEEEFTITIVNNNEAPTDIALSNASVAENSASGTVVGDLTTTDPDAGDTHTYSLVAGSGSTDNASFQIVGSQLQTAASFDFETKNSYSIRIRSTDSGGLSVEEEFTIAVTDVNEGPTLTAGGATPTFTEDDAAVAVDPGLTIADVDSTMIQSATVQITGNYQNGQDVLAFVNTPNITASFDAPTGKLTLTGSDTLANYQAALRSVTYNNTSQNPNTTSRAVTFQAKDAGGADSNTAVTNVTVVAVNDAPVVTAGGTLNYTENDAATSIDTGVTVTDVDDTNIESATVQITANYVDGQDVLSFVNTPNIIGSFNSATGTLTLTGSDTLANYQAALRSVRYNNPSDDPTTTARTVTWQVNDGGPVNPTSTAVTSTINVTAVNDKPTAFGYTNLPAQAGIPITYPAGKLGGTDIEAGTTITINTTPDTLCTGCLLTINGDGSFTFTPPPSAAGTTVGFTYHVSDNGNPAPGVNSDPATVSFAVAGPEIYFVKQPAVGAANCTLGNECTLSQATAAIGSRTNVRIFISDASTHPSGATLTDGSWLIGQGVMGTTFDTLFGINAPAQGTLASRPSVGLSRPTLSAAAATVTAHNSSAVRGLNIDVSAGSNAGLVAASRTGTLLFSDMNVTSAAGNAIDLTNTSANFNGPHAISTTGGTGFKATGGGTVNVTQNNSTVVNTISATTGQGLNVTDTTIGSSGITFRSISAGTGSGSAGAGIILDNTGNSGGSFQVTGLDGVDAGTDPDAGSGGTIQHKTGADITDTNLPANISGTSGVGIFLRSTRNINLAGMQLNDFDNYAIFGSSVVNFTLTSSTINGVNGTNPNNKDAAFAFQNLTGSASVTKTTIQGGIFDNVRVVNNTGTLDRITFDEFTEGPMDSGISNGNDGMHFQAQGSAVMKVTIEDSSLLSARGDLLQFDLQSTAVGDLVFRRNTVDNQHPNVVTGGGGLTLSGGGTSNATPTMTYDIGSGAGNGNTFAGARGSMLLIIFQTGSGSATGRIENNTFGNASKNCSSEATCIEVRTEGRAGQTTFINNNNLQKYGGQGMYFEFDGINTGGSTGTIGQLNATVTNNTIQTPLAAGTTTSAGIHINFGATSSPTADTYIGCADIQNNNAQNAGDESSPSAGSDYVLRQRANTTIRLPGYTGGNSDNAAVTTYIRNRNANGASSSVFNSDTVGSGGNGFTNTTPAGSQCTQPPPPSAPAFSSGAETGAAIRRKVEMMEGSGAAADPAATVAAPAASEPAPAAAPAPARVWSDMPIIIRRAPRSDSAADEKKSDEEEDEDKAKDEAKDEVAPAKESDAATSDDAAPKSDAAAPKKAKKPARVKKSAEQTEQQPEAQPENRNISYLGPLGSAPSRAPRFARASYEAGDAVAPTARRAPAKRTTKAAPARAAAPLFAGETVDVNIGTMPAGKSVKIRFSVTVNNPSAVTQVSNQGTVTADGGISVDTDDPSVGANTPGEEDPTVTNVAVQIRVHDAQVPEPTSGTIDMTFTIALSLPVPVGQTVGVSFDTANGGPNPATGGGCPGADYTISNGAATFTAGEQVKTFNVPVCSDAVADDGETFLVNLSNPTGFSTIADGQATGTITANTPGTILISELRTIGPNGAAEDDFVEIYNNSNNEHVVDSADNTGYGIFTMGADCFATPVLIATIPEGTKIPARGHFLAGGTAYSLKDYGGTNAAQKNATFTSPLGTDNNVGVFATANVAAISSVNRFDAVGFGANVGGACNLLREGSPPLPAQDGSLKDHTFFRSMKQATGGFPKDTNANSGDFLYANTEPDMPSSQLLGAPGPENLTSPVRKDHLPNGFAGLLLDRSVASSAHPNRTRNLSPGLGTMVVRRRIINNTGAPVTRLRFRIVEMTTFPSPPGTADLRAISGTSDENIFPINDADTCSATGTPSTPTCTVLVRRTTLETPPAQPAGGGYNATLSAGTISTGSQLAAGASINVSFVLDVQQTGNFRFLIIVEALP
jgi:hypothetical protein